MLAVWEFISHPAVFVPFFCLLYIFGGGAFLYIGGRFIARESEVTYGWSLITIIAATLAQIVTLLLLGCVIDGILFSPTAFFFVFAVSSFAACGIVGKMVEISYGKAIFAWLPLFAVQLVLISVFIPPMGPSKELAKRAVCKTRLKGLGTAMELYHQKYKTFPPSPKEFIEEGDASPKNFKCPSDIQDRDMSYFYLPPLETDDGATFVMCDLKGNHKDMRYVLMKDGVVKEFSEEAFHEQLTDPYNARFAVELKKAEGPP
jgi:competence protein ComGC